MQLVKVFMQKMTNLTTVININSGNTYDVYIGRPSIFGNPFKIGIDGNRQEVILKYKKWLYNNPKLLKEIDKLKGKILGCHCKPKKCHGDVLCDIINRRNFSL